MRVIGVVGFIGSGKGSVGDILRATYGFAPESFAKPLKDAVSIIFGWDREMLEGATKESRDWRELKDEFWSKKLGKTITPRLALQWMGTEAGRNVFGSPLWTASLQNRLLPAMNYVVTDCRFVNEVDAIREMRGHVIRVVRGEDPVWVPSAKIAKSKGFTEIPEHPTVHISEWDWINTEFDYVIDNSGSMLDLYRNVGNMLKSLR